MDPLSARHDSERRLTGKAALERELADLPIEQKLKMVQQLVKVASNAGTLPDWYYRLMEIPKPENR